MSPNSPPDPPADPELAEALSKLSEGLKEGEDPFFYDWRAKPRPKAISSGGVDEAKAYVPPITLPPTVAHKTFEMQRVQIAAHVDPRRAPTQPRLGMGAAPSPIEPFRPAESSPVPECVGAAPISAPSIDSEDPTPPIPPPSASAPGETRAPAACVGPTGTQPNLRGPSDTPYNAAPFSASSSELPAIDAATGTRLPAPGAPARAANRAAGPSPATARPDSGEVAIEMPISAWTPPPRTPGGMATSSRAGAPDAPASAARPRAGFVAVVGAAVVILGVIVVLAVRSSSKTGAGADAIRTTAALAPMPPATGVETSAARSESTTAAALPPSASASVERPAVPSAAPKSAAAKSSGRPTAARAPEPRPPPASTTPEPTAKPAATPAASSGGRWF